MTATVKTNATRIAAIAMAAFLLTGTSGAFAASCVNPDTTRSLSSSTTNDNDWDQHKANVKGFHCAVNG
jgi:hypothetical protein